jgi:hypothetical protein
VGNAVLLVHAVRINVVTKKRDERKGLENKGLENR